jgi:hypothetical protein
MASEKWIARLWARVRSGVIQDVPPALEACETCREASCTQARWERCEHRLTTEAATLAVHGPHAARTGELMPYVPLHVAAPRLDAKPETPPPAAEQPRARKISNH